MIRVKRIITIYEIEGKPGAESSYDVRTLALDSRRVEEEVWTRQRPDEAASLVKGLVAGLDVN